MLGDGNQIILALRPNDNMSFATVHSGPRPSVGDTVLAFIQANSAAPEDN